MYVILKELKTFLDGGLPLLKKLEEGFSEELDQFYEWMIRHVLKLFADGVEFGLILEC